MIASYAAYAEEANETAQRVLGSCALLAVYLSLLYYLKASSSVSFLIEVLVQVLADMAPFLLVLGVVGVGVALAMAVLTAGGVAASDDPEAGAYAQFGSALFRVLRIAEGRLDYQEPAFPEHLDQGVLSRMFHFLFIVLLFIVTVAPLI